MPSRLLICICIVFVCSHLCMHASRAGAANPSLQASPGEQTPNQPPATQPAQRPAAPPPSPPGGSMSDKLNRIAELTATAVEKAHGGAAWHARSALQCEVSMTCGEQTLAGTLAFQINGQGIRLQLRDGTTLVTDGTTTWVTPASSALKPGEASRLLHTFKVFAAAPLLLKARGMKQTAYRTLHFMGENADAFRLALSPGMSAAAGEGGWCMAYAEQRSHRLKGFANIALPFAPPADHQTDVKPAYTIAYTSMQTIEEVVLPAEWTFYEWTEAAGAKGQAFASGKSEQAQFVRLNEDAFARPEDARTDTPAAEAEAGAGAKQP
jgi:hypothetical protein